MGGPDIAAVVAWIRETGDHLGSLRDAAWIYKRRNPQEATRVLEAIGCWPSSEPELRALQAIS